MAAASSSGHSDGRKCPQPSPTTPPLTRSPIAATAARRVSPTPSPPPSASTGIGSRLAASAGRRSSRRREATDIVVERGGLDRVASRGLGGEQPGQIGALAPLHQDL